MKSIKDGSIIAFSSNFNYKDSASWEHLFTKPLHYGIQTVTGSDYHHVGIMMDGYLWEAMAKYGVRRIKLEDKIKELDSVVNVYCFAPVEDWNYEQISSVRQWLWSRNGKRYSAAQALFSTLDRIIFFRLFKTKARNKLAFCSKLVAGAKKQAHPIRLKNIIPVTYNPKEIINMALNKGLVRSGTIINR